MLVVLTIYCINRIASGGYYGLCMSTLPPPTPQCVEIFYLSTDLDRSMDRSMDEETKKKSHGNVSVK